MAENEADYITQDDIAKAIEVDVNKVRGAVAALAGIGAIKTLRSVKDKRYLLVHKDAVEKIRQAIFNAP